MFYEQNYLMHHGITGQKWGVRRYQNEDGTLTEEGRARYETEGSGSDKEGSLSAERRPVTVEDTRQSKENLRRGYTRSLVNSLARAVFGKSIRNIGTWMAFSGNRPVALAGRIMRAAGGITLASAAFRTVVGTAGFLVGNAALNVQEAQLLNEEKASKKS